MPKTLQSNLFDAQVRRDFWIDTANDKQALEDRGIEREDALLIANEFERKITRLEEGIDE
jgi:hypothetical protein